MPRASVNYLRTLPSGAVEAVFPGGIIIDADSVPATVTPEHTVRWVRHADGALVAYVSGGVFPDAGPVTHSEATFVAQVGPPTLPTRRADITLVADTLDAQFQSAVQATADGNPAVILSGTRKSSFVQQMQANKAYVAVVYVVGTTGAVFYSSQVGISVVRNAVGIYTVSWPVGFPSSAPAGVVMPQIQPSTGGGCIGSQYLVAAPTSAQYATFPGSGIASDSDHSLFFWIA
jgi:hypothetical protein